MFKHNVRMTIRGIFTSERKGGWGKAFRWLRTSAKILRSKTVNEYSLAS